VNYFRLLSYGLCLVVLQMMISNLLFFGKLVMEISLIMVIYAGFHEKLLRGVLLSFLMGIFLDCFMGSVSGLFACSYVICFFLAKFFSLRIYAERASFIMLIVGLCAILEGFMVVAFYEIAYGVDKFRHLWDVFTPQAFLLSVLGPFFFQLFHKIEVLNGGDTRSVERSAIG